jgi:hypothetical protein
MVRIADRVLRRLQRSHAGLRRSGEIEALLADAGLARPRTSWLMGGTYAIVRAAKG